MKIASVEFVFSNEIDNYVELIGHFEAQFVYANHKETLKRKNEGKEGQDPRAVRILTNVEHYKVTAKEEFMNSDSYNLQKVGSFSALTSKEFVNVRASIADPEWCEARVHEVCKDAKQVKEVKVIKGQELVDLGMNLIWNVGRGAVKEPRGVFVHYKGNEASD